jgi:diacylglycerol kinase
LRIHLFAAVFIIIMGFAFKLTYIEWSILLIIISIVFITEIINSSIECLADFVSPKYSSFIKIIKDYAAAAVLIAAITSIIIGLIFFLPKFLS